MGISDLKIHLSPSTISEIAPGIPITNTMITMWIIMGLMVVVALIIRLRLRFLPSGFQNLVEWALGGMHDFMKEVGGQAAQKHFPIFITFFLTILFSNWLGIALGMIAEESGFLRVPTSDLNSTAGLALIAFIYFEYHGMKAHGVFGHLSHFFNIKALFTKGFVGVIEFFVSILHIISELVRPVALSLRLFGNILAGEIVLTVVFLLVPPMVPLPFMIMEFIIGIIQAFVFSILFLTFTSLNTAHQEDDHETITPTKEETPPPVKILVG